MNFDTDYLLWICFRICCCMVIYSALSLRPHNQSINQSINQNTFL